MNATLSTETRTAMNTTPKRHRIRRLPLATLLLAVAIAGCSSADATDGGQAKDTISGAAHEKPVNVELRTLAYEPFSSPLLLVGEVQAEHSAQLASQVAGALTAIVADRGAGVAAGDTLLVIDPRRYRAAREIALAQKENAELDWRMADRLYQAGQGISENDWRKAANGLRMAEAQLLNASIDLDHCFITAPVAGVVAERFVDLGELVSPGMPLLHLVQQDELKVRAGLPEAQASVGRIGLSATIRVPEAGIEAEGRLRWVGAVLDGRSRTLPVEIAIREVPAALKPGMACQIELRRDRGSRAIVVPVTVVQHAPDHEFVFVEQNKHAVVRPVRLGLRDGERVEVLEGLSAGEQLVVSGQRGLVDGQPLNIVAAR
jgi:membrane fusion protein, multidrug efflux system